MSTFTFTFIPHKRGLDIFFQTKTHLGQMTQQSKPCSNQLVVVGTVMWWDIFMLGLLLQWEPASNW